MKQCPGFVLKKKLTWCGPQCCVSTRALCSCGTEMISDVSVDFAWTSSVTVNCCCTHLSFHTSSWQLLPPLSICLITVEHLFRLTCALNWRSSWDWSFNGDFFSLTAGSIKVRVWVPCKLLILVVNSPCSVMVERRLTRSGDELLRHVGHLEEVCVWFFFFCLSGGSNEDLEEEPWIHCREFLSTSSRVTLTRSFDYSQLPLLMVKEIYVLPGWSRQMCALYRR